MNERGKLNIGIKTHSQLIFYLYFSIQGTFNSFLLPAFWALSYFPTMPCKIFYRNLLSIYKMAETSLGKNISGVFFSFRIIHVKEETFPNGGRV